MLSLVPSGVPRRPVGEHGRPGSFADVLRHRSFMVVIGLNLVLITSGLSQIDVLPAYMKNIAGVSELGISAVFAANTLLIVLAAAPRHPQPARPAADAHAGHGGVLWGACWLFVPVVGVSSASRRDCGSALRARRRGARRSASACTARSRRRSSTDLADDRLMGRYMAVSAFSWSAGFGLGPAFGGFMLGRSPTLLWMVTGGTCVLAGLAAPALERVIPVRRA